MDELTLRTKKSMGKFRSDSSIGLQDTDSQDQNKQYSMLQ